MSSDDVEAVTRFFPPAGTDYVRLFRDDAAWTAAKAAAERCVEPGFHGAFIALGQEQASFTGLEGMRAGWLEWLGPWESYYDEIENVLAVGDDLVLALARERGRRRDTGAEVVAETGAVYRLRRGRIARVDYYATRPEAMEAVGLPERDDDERR